MSIVDANAYFRSKLNSENLTEWRDAHNFDNIPKTVLDRAYNIGEIDIVGVQNNQLTQQIDYSVTIRLFFKNFRKTDSGRDAAIQKADEVACAMVKPEDRTEFMSVKNVVFDSMTVEDQIDTNDNVSVVQMGFTARFYQRLTT